MSDNVRFHSKHHGKSHHTKVTQGYHDSAIDPIASSTSPFMGDFHLSGCAVIYDTTVVADTSKTVCYNDFITYYDGTYTTVRDNSGSWTATGNSKWTVDGNNLLLEVHLLDFDQNIYGKELTVEFLTFIRDEKKFDNFALLTEQIRKDIKLVKAYHSKK